MPNLIERPLTRYVIGAKGKQYVATLSATHLVLRPKRARAMQAMVGVTWATLYDKLIWEAAQAAANQRKPRRVKRGTQLRVRKSRD